MQTAEENCAEVRPSLLIDLRPEDLAVAFLLKRFKEMSKESFTDIVSLMEAMLNPDTTPEEQLEIFETAREILFPELVGQVHMGRAGSIKQTPEKLQKRIDHVGRRIAKIRKDKKLTQQQLAKRSGLPQSHISRLEGGVHSPALKSLQKIARALEVDVGDLDPSH